MWWLGAFDRNGETKEWFGEPTVRAGEATVRPAERTDSAVVLKDCEGVMDRAGEMTDAMEVMPPFSRGIWTSLPCLESTLR